MVETDNFTRNGTQGLTEMEYLMTISLQTKGFGQLYAFQYVLPIVTVVMSVGQILFLINYNAELLNWVFLERTVLILTLKS